MAQHQHQGLGYCQNLFQPDSESCFYCLVTYWTEDALTASLHANSTAFPQHQENSLSLSLSPSRWLPLSPSRWLPLSGKFCVEGIWINYERLPVTELEEVISRVGRNQIFQRDLQAVSGKCLQKARLIVLCCLSTRVRPGSPSMSYRPPCMACETQPVILTVPHRPSHGACESLCAQDGNGTTGVLATAWHWLKIP